MEEHTAWPTGPESRARYKITLDGGCLRAEFRNRGTTEDMEKFLWTVAATSKVLEQGHVLISVDSANPLSMLERSIFFARLNDLWQRPSHKVAVLGDSVNPGTPHAYVRSFAEQHGVNVRSFDDETTALQWVMDRRLGRDRRRAERLPFPYERRQCQRRYGAQAFAPA